MLGWLLITLVNVQAATATAQTPSSSSLSLPAATVDDASAAALLAAFPKRVLARSRIVDLLSHASDAFLERNATTLVKLAAADEDDAVTSDILMLLVERIPADHWRKRRLRGNAPRFRAIFEKPRGGPDAYATVLFGRCHKPSKRPLDVLLKRSVSHFEFSLDGQRGARMALYEWGERAFPLFEKELQSKRQEMSAKRLIAQVAEAHGEKAHRMAKALRAARASASEREQHGYDDALQAVDPQPWTDIVDGCVANAATATDAAQGECERWIAKNVSALDPSAPIVDFLLKRAERRFSRSDLRSTLARLTPPSEHKRVVDRLAADLSDLGDGDDAALGLTVMGPDGLRALTTALSKTEPRIVRNVLSVLPQLSPPPPGWRAVIEKHLSESKHDGVRHAAAQALVVYGPAALPAFKRALETEKDARVQNVMIEGLGKIGDAALLTLVDQLKAHPERVAKTLARLGPKAAGVAAELSPYLTSGYDVPFALPQLGEPGFNVLREALFDDDEAVRLAALSGLNGAKIWGPLSAEAAEDVCRVLYDPSPKVVREAVQILLNQPPDRLSACKHDLLEALSQDDFVAGRALYLLSTMALDDKERATVTNTISKQSHRELDEYALRAAINLKMKERRAWTKNALARNRSARFANTAAISGAATLGMRDPETIENLGALLAHERSYVRSAAARALLRLKVKKHVVDAWLVLEAQHNDFGFIQPPDL